MTDSTSIPTSAERRAAKRAVSMMVRGRWQSREFERFFEGIRYHGQILRSKAVVLEILRHWLRGGEFQNEMADYAGMVKQWLTVYGNPNGLALM